MDKYYIAVGETLNNLEATVNDKMDEGYVPHGSLVAEPQVGFIQAMVRVEVIPTNPK